MILLNFDTCIRIIRISIYNIWYIYTCSGGECSTTSTLLHDGHEEEIGLKRKDIKGIFFRRTMTGWYENAFCKNKRNLMLPFVKWKACAFCSRAIAYIKTQLHWISLNNFAYTNDVNKKEFRQNNTSTIFPFHQLFNSKLYTYIWMFKFAWGFFPPKNLLGTLETSFRGRSTRKDLRIVRSNGSSSLEASPVIIVNIL